MEVEEVSKGQGTIRVIGENGVIGRTCWWDGNGTTSSEHIWGIIRRIINGVICWRAMSTWRFAL